MYANFWSINQITEDELLVTHSDNPYASQMMRSKGNQIRREFETLIANKTAVNLLRWTQESEKYKSSRTRIAKRQQRWAKREKHGNYVEDLIHSKLHIVSSIIEAIDYNRD